MSKSVGNVVDPLDLVTKYGLDPVRFFLLREVPFGNDGDFSPRALTSRMTVELANDLGNLAQRVLKLVVQACDGKLPAPGPVTAEDTALLAEAAALPDRMRTAVDQQALNQGIEEVWKVIRAANAYIDQQAPWTLRRTAPERAGYVLRVLTDALRAIATVLQPVMPGSMARMLDQLGVPVDQRQLAALSTPLQAGIALPPPEGIFPKWVEETGAIN